jgi:hypothetical protein
MKKIVTVISVVVIFILNSQAQEIPAYFEIGNSTENMNKVQTQIKDALQASDFKIIGEYNPGKSENLAVICYTHPDLEKIALGFTDRGALAAALKVGLKNEGNSIKISMLNPLYLFYAYFIEGIDNQEQKLSQISENAKKALKIFNAEFVSFGGELDKDKLQKYHYKVMMPYFKDAEELNEFGSFEEGLKTIRGNLTQEKENTIKVYELVYPDQKTAVFGVGLLNQENGESKFLPIIGDDHIAAMPYEIILQGNKATILPGRYRIALHWPELTMGTFMKIMSTPGEIKTTLEALTK